MAKKGKKSAQSPVSDKNADFLPLDGGSKGVKLPVENSSGNKATVLYIGRIPHGFYEDEMLGFFKQFGTVKRLRIARNRKTGKSKHYGFVEFEYPEVASIVAECMHNQLLFGHLLQVHLVPPERVHRKLWVGAGRPFRPVDFVHIQRKRMNKDRTVDEHQKLLERIVKRDKKKRKLIEAAGLEYECPEIVGVNQPLPKKITFDEDE